MVVHRILGMVKSGSTDESEYTNYQHTEKRLRLINVLPAGMLSIDKS